MAAKAAFIEAMQATDRASRRFLTGRLESMLFVLSLAFQAAVRKRVIPARSKGPVGRIGPTDPPTGASRDSDVMTKIELANKETSTSSQIEID